MLYFNTRDQQHILVLEPEHLKVLAQGGILKSPNRAVLLLYTPDAVWLSEQIIANVENLTPDLLESLILQSQKLPEKPVGSYFPPMQVIKDGKIQKD